MKKKAALTLAALFVAATTLAGCKDESPAQNTTPGGVSDIYDTSFLDRQYLITIDDMAIRTATGRELHVTTRAFCQIEEDKHRTLEAYKAACREIIGEKLLYSARHEDSISPFEAYPPMGSKEIRPYNYFDDEMLLRALGPRYKQNLYTVTDVRDCATGERTPTMNPYRPAPEGGWPNAEERKKSQIATPVYGSVVGGKCQFN